MSGWTILDVAEGRMDYEDVGGECKTFVILIDGEPVASLRATERDIERFDAADAQNDILRSLGAVYREGTRQPVWDAPLA